MIRVGGRGAVQVDSLSTVTSDGGFWRLSTAAIVEDSALFRFRIYSPLLPQPYTVFRWVVATARKGEAYVADRWVINLWFPYIVQFYRRGRPDELFPQVPLTFHRLSGPHILEANANGDIRSSTDGSGVAQLFLYNAFASDTGTIEGEVIAELPAPYGTSRTILDLAASPTYHAQVQFLRAALGPSLQYTAAVTDGAARPLPGARVDFQRTGGIDVEPTSFSTVADASGRISLPLVPSAPGTVTGTVTITPPTGSRSSFPVSIATFDTDETRFLATWSIGSSPP